MSEKVKVGIQLYTLRDLLDKDFVGTLKQVKQMGYECVEFAGNYGGFSAAELKNLCAEIGLEIASTHCSYENFDKDFEGTVTYHKDLGLHYLAIPWMPADKCPGKPGFDGIKDLFVKMSKELAQNGITLMYHNHDFEFFSLPDGTLSYQRLLEEVPGMNPEFDVCWLTYAYQDPIEYIKKYSGRIDVLHLKDYTGRNDNPAYALIDADGNAVEAEKKAAVNNFRFQSVGYGEVKMTEIIPAAIANGTKYLIVEQDDCYGDPIAAATKSIAYIRSLGI